MALRGLYFVLALTMLIASGCRSRSSYQPACAPVVATPVCPPPCPPPCPGPIPGPPPVGVLVPR